MNQSLRCTCIIGTKGIIIIVLSKFLMPLPSFNSTVLIGIAFQTRYNSDCITGFGSDKIASISLLDNFFYDIWCGNNTKLNGTNEYFASVISMTIMHYNALPLIYIFILYFNSYLIY